MLVLGLVIVGVGAVVVIYTVRAVKPKRVRFSAGFWKVLTMSFEADSDSDSSDSKKPGTP